MCKDRGRDGLTRLLSLELRACSLHAHATRPFPLTATSASPGFSPPVVWLGRDGAALLALYADAIEFGLI